MSCPVCGSTMHVLVAPGVAECRGSVSRPTGLHPSGAMGPTIAYQTCGNRYQVPIPGGITEYCSCGMGAIARCVQCGKPLCLDHSVRHPEGILCAQHASDAQARASSAAADRLEVALDRMSKAALRIKAGNAKLPPPEFRLTSSVSASQVDLSSVKAGQACPVHPSCRVAGVRTEGKLIKRPTGMTCSRDMWLLAHRFQPYADVSAHTHSDAWCDWIGVDASGDIVSGSSFDMGMDGTVTIGNDRTYAIDPANPHMLELWSRLSRLSFVELAERISNELAVLGGTPGDRHAAESCR